MAGRKCFLYGWSVVVDAAVKSAGPEEGGLGASSVEQVNELRGVLVRTVVVSESEDAGPGALAYDNAGRWLSAKKLERLSTGRAAARGAKARAREGNMVAGECMRCRRGCVPQSSVVLNMFAGLGELSSYVPVPGEQGSHLPDDPMP